MLVLLVGCGLSDAGFSTGSGSLVADPDRAALFATNPDEGTVSRVAAGEVERITLGGEPGRIARARSALYVTKRAEREVVRVDAESLTVTATATVGAEPVGVVVDEAGTRVYVAASMSGEVVELDGDLVELRRFAVADQPTWIALHPSERSLWVASAMGGRLSRIDLDAGTVHDIEMPELRRAVDAPLSARLTGDPSVSPDGSELIVPSVWVDNTTPVEDDIGDGVSSGGYGSVGMALSRINPALVQLSLASDGAPKDDEVRVGFVAGFAPVLRGATDEMIARSYLGSARYSPDGRTIWATMDASHTVVAIASDFMWTQDEQFSDTGTGSLSAPDGGFWTTLASFVATEEGPRSVAFLDGETWVHNGIDRTLARLPAEAVADTLQTADGLNLLASHSSDAGLVLETSGLSDMAEAGRRLFHSATDAGMVGGGAGVSCSTCHLDGRNDGLTWPLASGERQTISLAGVDPATAPFTWTGGVESVGAEAQATASERMGGDGLSAAQEEAIATYLMGTRPVDHADKGATSDAVTRGAALFARADVACAACHAGPAFVDNKAHDLYGLIGVDTPTLVGVAASGPWLHDGSAKTLRELLEGATAAGMGDTSMLTPQDLDDLEAYLRTL